MIEIKVVHNREELEKLYQWWTENGRRKGWEFQMGFCGLEADVVTAPTDYPQCYRFSTPDCIYMGRYVPQCYGVIK